MSRVRLDEGIEGEVAHDGEVRIFARQHYVFISIPCGDAYEARVKAEGFNESVDHGEFILIRKIQE